MSNPVILELGERATSIVVVLFVIASMVATGLELSIRDIIASLCSIPPVVVALRQSLSRAPRGLAKAIA